MKTNSEPDTNRSQPLVSAQLQHKLDRYFLACSAGVGASLAVVTGGGTDAKADIIYSGTQNITVPASNFAGIYFDFDTNTTSTTNVVNSSDANLFDTYGLGNDGTNNYFYHTLAFFGPNRVNNSALATLTTINGQTLKLSAGFSIGPSPSTGVFGNQNYLATRNYDYTNGTPLGPLSGQWASGGTGFLGFRFTDANGQTDFGWMRISFDPTNFTNQLNAAVVIDWAYNNAGGPIAAGQIPEPSSIALALLGAGAIGLALWRQRRQQEQASPKV